MGSTDRTTPPAATRLSLWDTVSIIVGIIVGVFDGALDGLRAQLISRTRCGYTVQLLESKDAFCKGDTVHLSVAEFYIHKEE